MKTNRFKFRIYRNLHKGAFSIQAWDEVKKGYRVIAWETDIIARDCGFKVYEAGRQRVLKRQKKNVHAFLLCQHYEVRHSEGGDGIFYNPYKQDCFTGVSGERIDRAESVCLRDSKMYFDA